MSDTQHDATPSECDFISFTTGILFFPIFDVFFSHILEVSIPLDVICLLNWKNLSDCDAQLLHVHKNLNFAALVVRVCIKKNMGVVEGGGTCGRVWRKEKREVQEDKLRRLIGFSLTLCPSQDLSSPVSQFRRLCLSLPTLLNSQAANKSPCTSPPGLPGLNCSCKGMGQR